MQVERIVLDLYDKDIYPVDSGYPEDFDIFRLFSEIEELYEYWGNHRHPKGSCEGLDFKISILHLFKARNEIVKKFLEEVENGGIPRRYDYMYSKPLIPTYRGEQMILGRTREGYHVIPYLTGMWDGDELYFSIF